jgi:hypothetical protein
MPHAAGRAARTNANAPAATHSRKTPDMKTRIGSAIAGAAASAARNLGAARAAIMITRSAAPPSPAPAAGRSAAPVRHAALIKIEINFNR